MQQIFKKDDVTIFFLIRDSQHVKHFITVKFGNNLRSILSSRLGATVFQIE